MRKPLSGVCTGSGNLKRERSPAFHFLEFLGKRNEKKYGQTELNSPSNLPTVTFDRRANAREEQSGNKSPWS